jgi:hypothetical protein
MSVKICIWAAKIRQSGNNFVMGSLQLGYRTASSSFGGKGKLKFRLYISFLFAGRDFEEIRRERAGFVHVSCDRVQRRIEIAIRMFRVP